MENLHDLKRRASSCGGGVNDRGGGTGGDCGGSGGGGHAGRTRR